MNQPNGQPAARQLPPNGNPSRIRTPQNNQHQHAPPGGMNRAERFEDEKRRIVQSCFSKLDASGLELAESYITHLRIQEDSAYPSSPPPPDSLPENKKPRIIVIAVRSTGRVRMHKARENNNGSFSIGKTWNLEELSAIETFSSKAPTDDAQTLQRRQWAGDVGFTVVIVRPYYWQAGTPKERDFFVASLVKIYRKYTKGQVPELIGFDQLDKEMILGNVPPPQRADHQAPPSGARDGSYGTPPPLQSPFAQSDRAPSQESKQRAARAERYRESPDSSLVSQQRPSSESRQRPFDEPVRQRAPPTEGQYMQPPIAPPHDPAETPKHPSEEPLQQSRASSTQDQHLEQQQPPPHDLVRQPWRPSFVEQDLQQGEQARAPGRDQIKPSDLQHDSTRSGGNNPLDQPRTESSASLYLDPQGLPLGGRSSPALSRDSRKQRSFHSIRSANSITPWEEKQDETQSAAAKEPITTGAALFNATLNRWKPLGNALQGQQAPSPVEQRAEAPDSADDTTDLRNLPGAGEISRDFFPEPTRPERRRPPMRSPTVSDTGGDSIDLHPQPLSTGKSTRPQSPHAESTLERPDSIAHKTDHMPGAFYTTPTSSNLNLPTSQPVEGDPRTTPLSEDKSTTAIPGAFTPSAEVTPDLTPDREQTEEEAHRPGLGPMIKKKMNRSDVASKFRKAAIAQNAFKPRSGGAGQRLVQESQAKGEPDGINGVVPAPSLLRRTTEDSTRVPTPDLARKGTATPPVAEELPKVEVSSPVASLVVDQVDGHGARAVQLEDTRASAPTTGSAGVEAPPVPEPRRPKRRSNQQLKYLSSLDIDPNLLEGRGLDFEATLGQFGWGSIELENRTVDALEADLRRDLGRVEAGSWLGHLDQEDDRVEQVEKMLDRAVAECDELDGLLTLYSVELSSLNDDIAFIEAQSQGLQVQTANQKLLHTELQHLVDTISITPEQLDPLRRGDLSNAHGLEDVESSLLLLYKAMLTIDPKLRSAHAVAIPEPDSSRRKSAGGYGSQELSQMRALQEKRESYMQQSDQFLQRFMQQVDRSFSLAILTAKDGLNRPATGNALKLNSGAFVSARAGLWQYSPLLL
ncbi:hypothetical protein LTR28_004918, partial [Elasticomyces elasticus]